MKVGHRCIKENQFEKKIYNLRFLPPLSLTRSKRRLAELNDQELYSSQLMLLVSHLDPPKLDTDLIEYTNNKLNQ